MEGGGSGPDCLTAVASSAVAAPLQCDKQQRQLIMLPLLRASLASYSITGGGGPLACSGAWAQDRMRVTIDNQSRFNPSL